jgi:uncharacterized protein YndB with AHSA1/START domain
MSREKFEMEFLFRASPAIVYRFLTTPSGLVRWFCDKADITGDTYEFSWDGYSEIAVLAEDIEEERLRFKWEDAEDDEYLEFRMYKSEVTNETIVEITDFADDDDIEDQKQLWRSQFDIMRSEMGG